LIHESGHAIVALITSAEVSAYKFVYRYFRKCSLLNQAIGLAGSLLLWQVSIIGITAMLFFYLIKDHHYTYIVYILGGLSIVNLIFFVRNGYGIFWLVTFILILGALIYFNDDFSLFSSSVSSLLLY